MDISIKKKVIIDMKKQSGKVVLSPFIQHDSNIIQLEILNDNAFPNFTSSTSFIVNFKRSDKRVFSSIQTPIQNIIEYQLTANDMEKTGDYELTLQILEGEKRITSFVVQGKITKTLSANFDYEEKEYQPIVQQLLSEVSSASGDFNSLNDRLNNMVIEGGGGGSIPSNVILFENWTSGESVTIGGAETDTTAPVLTITTGGTFTGTKTVTMTTNEAATIYYTLDNSTPTVNSSVYTAPLTISATTTLKAFAKDTAGNVSAVQTIVYSLIVPEPGDTTPPNNVTNLQVSNNTTGTSLTLSWTASSSTDVAGYDVYRGSTLLTTITGTSYNVTGLTVNTEYTFTVKAKDTSNNVASGTSVTVTTVYVDNVAPVLTITPASTFTDNKTITMSTNETATIYYTTNGDTPTVSSLVYSTPLTITATTTIKAFAKDTSGNVSAIQNVTFTKVTAQDYVTDNLEIYYNFTTHATTPSTATDLSGNGNNGELRGYGTTATSGINNGELVGDGIGDYIHIPRTEKLKAYPFTVEFYLRVMYTDETLKTPKQARLFDVQFDTNGTGSGVNLYANADANTTLPSTINLTGSLGQPASLSASHNLFDNQYTHIAVVWEAGKQTIYVNGVQKATQNSTSPSMTTSTRNMYLLTAGNSNDSLRGAIKKFRYYTKALSATEINQNYLEVTK